METERPALIRPALGLLGRNFFAHGVGKSAAALAYHMIFALFPVLIFFSNLLGLLDLDVSAITLTLQRVMPAEAVGLVESYLQHVSASSSHFMMWFSLVLSVWFPMRAVHGLMDDVRKAYGLGKPHRRVWYSIRQLVYTVVFLIAIVLTLVLSVAGEQFLTFLAATLPSNIFPASQTLLDLWQYLRFLPAALMMLVAIGALYCAALDKRQKITTLLPGIFLAFALWFIVCIGFSFYVENFALFSLMYGAVGAVIILLIWLYFTAALLILGAEWNAALQTVRAQNQARTEIQNQSE